MPNPVVFQNRLRSAFWNAKLEGYASEPGGAEPAHMWDLGVLLSSFVAAAEETRTRFRRELAECFESLEPYWVSDGTESAYSATKGQRDWFYDDNEWVGIALCDAYRITRDARYLKRAKEIYQFVAKGWDDTFGGGIRWHYPSHLEKNTCSNAPAAVLALKLYFIEHDTQSLRFAENLIQWTKRKLSDPADGLFWDHLSVDGSVDKTKWTYNTALMLRAYRLYGYATGNARFFATSSEISQMAVAHWQMGKAEIQTDFHEDVSFVHLLCESMYPLDFTGGIPLGPSDRASTEARIHVRDFVGPDGWYGKYWRKLPTGNSKLLLWQASTARTMWTLKKYERISKASK